MSTEAAIQTGIQHDGKPIRATPIHALAVLARNELWLPGQTLSVFFFPGNHRDDVDFFMSAVKDNWMPHVNLQLQEVKEQGKADFTVDFPVDPSNSSTVGTASKRFSYDKKTATMRLGGVHYEGGFDQWSKRLCLHEFGHVLGFVHEHQGPAAPEWNHQALVKFCNTKGMKESEMKHNYLNRYKEEEVFYSEFDPSSIMLYEIPASANPSGEHLPAPLQLSLSDVEAAQAMYPHLSINSYDTQTFDIAESRTPSEEPSWNATCVKRFPPRDSAPKIVCWAICGFDLEPRALDARVAISALAERFQGEAFVMHLDSIHQTTMHAGRVNWVDPLLASSNHDIRFQTSQKDLAIVRKSAFWTQAVQFNSKFGSSDHVTVVSFISKFSTHSNTPWSIKLLDLKREDVEPHRFRQNTQVTGNHSFETVGINWAAWVSSKQSIQVGRVSPTMFTEKPESSGRVKFIPGTFNRAPQGGGMVQKVPQVMAGFYLLDFRKERAAAKIKIIGVSQDGFNFKISTKKIYMPCSVGVS